MWTVKQDNKRELKIMAAWHFKNARLPYYMRKHEKERPIVVTENRAGKPL
jgi:hypothetical protein